MAAGGRLPRPAGTWMERKGGYVPTGGGKSGREDLNLRPLEPHLICMIRPIDGHLSMSVDISGVLRWVNFMCPPVGVFDLVGVLDWTIFFSIGN